MDFAELETKTLGELRELSKSMEISGYSRLKKEDLILRLLRAKAEQQGYSFGGGVLDIVEDGIGFLRADHYLPGPEDVYVSQSQIRRFGLRTGDMVVGQVRPPKENEKYFGLLRVEAVNGLDPEQAKARPVFEKLTPIFPNHRYNLETDPHNLTTRLLDMVAPVGQGQRGPDCLAAQGWQNDGAQAHRQCDFTQLPRSPPHGCSDRGAPGGSHRYGPLGGCRGDFQYL